MPIEVPFVRSPYNYDVDQASDESGLSCPEPTRTQQHQAEEADINTIVKRFGITGTLPQGLRVPTYEDFSEVVDFHTAQLAIRSAQESFYRLPAAVRARFQNDAGLFVDFCSDPSNLSELREMGLAAPGAPQEAPVDPSAASSSGS